VRGFLLVVTVDVRVRCHLFKPRNFACTVSVWRREAVSDLKISVVEAVPSKHTEFR
jgi:hypothetical protein